MAKAVFEQQPQGDDHFAIVPARRAGNRDIHTPVYEDLPGGRRKVKEWNVESKKGTTIPLSGPDRRVFEEDYSDTEAPRVEAAQRRFQAGLNDRLSQEIDKLGAKVDSGTAKKDEIAQHAKYQSYWRSNQFKPLEESREETATRILKSGADLAQKVRLPGEGRMPGAGWYFDQNADLSAGLVTKSPEAKDALITSSGSMSPLNAPDQEARAARELHRAHATGATVTVSKGAHKWLKGKVDPEHHDAITPNMPTPVNDLHHSVVSSLARRTRRDKFPGVDKTSEVDFSEVARGGTNVEKGVRGARGESSDVLTPPTSAPKVSNYTMNIRVHDAPESVQTDYRDRVNSTADLTSDSPKWDAPRPGISEDRTLHLDDGTVGHLMKHLGEGTDLFDPEDRAVRQVKMNAGRTVPVDALHPRLVEALAHPTNTNGRARHLALTSHNMPTTQDSWVNAAILGQDSGQPGYKDSGSENLGYWKSAARVGLNSITDVPNTAVNRAKEGRANTREITTDAHQHAAQDKTIRMGARVASEMLGRSIPSVGVQEAHAWTEPRRNAGGDDAYNAARAAQESARSQQFKGVIG